MLQLVGLAVAGALAATAIRSWRRARLVWDERLQYRLLVAASSGFATMLAVAATLLLVSPLFTLDHLAVEYLQVGTGILTLGITLWEGEGDPDDEARTGTGP